MSTESEGRRPGWAARLLGFEGPGIKRVGVAPPELDPGDEEFLIGLIRQEAAKREQGKAEEASGTDFNDNP